jgi:hypothetical protein
MIINKYCSSRRSVVHTVSELGLFLCCFGASVLCKPKSEKFGCNMRIKVHWNDVILTAREMVVEGSK